MFFTGIYPIFQFIKFASNSNFYAFHIFHYGFQRTKDRCIVFFNFFYSFFNSFKKNWLLSSISFSTKAARKADFMQFGQNQKLSDCSLRSLIILSPRSQHWLQKYAEHLVQCLKFSRLPWIVQFSLLNFTIRLFSESFKRSGLLNFLPHDDFFILLM